MRALGAVSQRLVEALRICTKKVKTWYRVKGGGGLRRRFRVTGLGASHPKIKVYAHRCLEIYR